MEQAAAPSELTVHSAADAIEALDLDFGDEAEEQENDAPIQASSDESEEKSDETQDEISDETKSDDEEETDESTDEASPAIETLDDLAEALGQPLDDVLNNLTATVKINGELQQVTLKDAIDGFNLKQASMQNMQQAAEERRQVETIRQEANTEITRHHQTLGTIANQLRQAFVGSIDNAALEQLKAQDPARYLIAREEISERLKLFDNILQHGAQSYAELEQKQSTEKQQHLATYAQGEREKLIAAIPGWNEAKAKEIFGYLNQQGFDEKQLNSVYDHREILIAHKAMLWDQQNQKAKVVTQKVKQLPKLVKAGPVKKALSVDSNKLQSARKNLARTGKVRDAAALLESIL